MGVGLAAGAGDLGCGRAANFPTPALRADPRGEGVPWRDWGWGGEGVPFRECSFVSLRATRKQPTPTLVKKKNKRVGKSQPHAGPPPSRCRASLPPARRLARRSFALSSPFPGSRARGGAEKRTQERFGNVMGLGPGGEGPVSRHPILPAGSCAPPASGWLLSSLSLPRTFPGQLRLKFSGEAPRARGIRGRLGSAQDPSRTSPQLPRLAAGRVTPQGGGGHRGASKPGAGGEQGPAWFRVQLRREGGEGRL